MSLLAGIPAHLEASPDGALLTLFAGVLLIYFECNRPGTILPGCLGTLLTLLSVNAFDHMPLRASALAVAAVGIAFLLAEILKPSRNLLAAAGTILLIIGLRTSVQPFASAHVHTSIAVLTALGLATTSLWLTRIALRARHNKRSLSSLRSASERRTG